MTLPGSNAPTKASTKNPTSWRMLCFTLFFNAVFLAFWLRIIVMDPLKVEAIEMAHLDPTEIIAKPFALNKLALFVGGSIVALIGAQLLLSRFNGTIRDFLATAAIVYATMVLCGAHPFHDLLHTALTSLYATSLLVSLSTISRQQRKNNIMWKDRIVWKETMSREDCIGFVQLYSTVLIPIPFQILHILDWGSQVQRWPLPVVLGTTVGYIVGTLVGLAYATLFLHSKTL